MQRIFTLILLLVSALSAYADRQYSHHVIVAIDNAGTSSWITNRAVGRSVKRALGKAYPSIGLTSSLLQEDDYISIVKFDALTRADAVEKYYVKNAHSSVKPMTKAKDVRELHNGRFAIFWNSIPMFQYNGNFSILSVAKPYILQGIAKLVEQAKKDSMRIGRTFLVMVTDHHYNGNDFYDEINSWTQFTLKQNHAGCRILADSLSAFCRKVEQDYYIRYVATDTLKELGGRKYVELYEYQPLQQHFSLPSVVRFPAKIKAKRVFGGKYQICFPVTYQKEPHFSVDRLEIDLLDKDGNRVDCIDKIVLNNLTGEAEVSFIFDDINKVVIKEARFRGWIRINDGFYGFTQLVPYENVPSFLGPKGLTVNFEVEFEEDGKLFGIIRMPDFLWWYYHSDQRIGALMMSFTLLIIILLALAVFMWQALHYHPKQSQIQLRQIR